MPDSIWDLTLAAFRDRLGTRESVPAGVSTAAVSAAFAVGLLIKVLEIASKRKDFAGDGELAAQLIAEAREHSGTLTRCADEDIAAFRARSQAAIEVPLQVADSATSALALCERARPLVHAAIAPDLFTAALLLRSAAHSSLASLEANAKQLPAGDPFREEAMAEARELIQQCAEIMRSPWPQFRSDQ